MGIFVVLDLGSAMAIDDDTSLATLCSRGPSGIGRAIEAKMQSIVHIYLIMLHGQRIYIDRKYVSNVTSYLCNYMLGLSTKSF